MSSHTRKDEQVYQFQAIQQGQRLRANLQILDLLKEYFIENPDYRFGQGLCNLNIATHSLTNSSSSKETIYRDIFFEESKDLASRLELTIIE